MSGPTWRTGDEEPRRGAPDASGWLRILRRGVPITVLIVLGFALKLVLRLVERPFTGMRRPLSGRLTMCVCRATLWLMGLRLAVDGAPLRGQGALVANHTSWLDIFVLGATQPLTFVSKSEVADWPGIGWLARGTGTLFIARDPRAAPAQTALLRARLAQGQHLLFFPEGTSTDGRQVLTFKTTLFQPLLDDSLRPHLAVQPISVVYFAAADRDDRIYGWWGDMGFAPHLLSTLAEPRQGHVAVRLHAPLPARDYPDRKALAAAAEAAVRAGHADLRGVANQDLQSPG